MSLEELHKLERHRRDADRAYNDALTAFDAALIRIASQLPLAPGIDATRSPVPDGWRGFADFLVRQPDGIYEAVDTKLARHAKPYHVLQLCFYSEQVARLQGAEPRRMQFLSAVFAGHIALRIPESGTRRPFIGLDASPWHS